MSSLPILSYHNQVLISTHSPIFVNRLNIASNLIIDAGMVTPAQKVSDIQNVLGIVPSDNLIGADYVIVVEGDSDAAIIEKFIKEDDTLSKLYDSKNIIIWSIHGTNNIKHNAYALQLMCCNYIYIFDYDKAGKEAKNSLKTLSISDNSIRYFIKHSMKDTELEDLYNPNIYYDYLLSIGIDLSTDKATSIMKNDSIKWSDKINRIMATFARTLDQELECEIKMHIATKLVNSPIINCFTEEGYNCIRAIVDSIKNDIL